MEGYLGLSFLEKDIEKTFYSLKEYRVQQVDNPKISLIGVLFALDADIVYHERKIYNILDLVGDIGGLADGLVGLGTAFLFFVSLLTGDGPHVPMIENVFKTRGKTQKSTDSFKSKIR